MRERMAQHRANPACAGCHKLMDPAGFSMENYDAIGRWRTQETGRVIDASGGLPDGSTFTGVDGLQKALMSRPEAFVGTMTEKLMTYSLGRGVTYADAPAVRKIVRRQPRKRLPFFVPGFGYRQQYAISNEENTMIVTRKALPRRTFLRGLGTTLALPLLDAMAPAATALAAPARRLGFLYVPMGAHRPTWNLPGKDLTELSPTLSPLANVREYCTVVDNLELRNAYPGTHATSNAAYLSAAKSKWTESSDYYLGTTVDQLGRAADRQGDAAAVARTVDGPGVNGWPVRQRLRLRVPEQPLVVVADDAAAFRSASAQSVRAAVRRWRQLSRPTGGDAEERQPARLDAVRHRAPAAQARRGRPQQGERVSRFGARGRAAHSEGGSRDRRFAPARSRPARRRARQVFRPREVDDRSAGSGMAGRCDARDCLPACPRDQQSRLYRDRHRRRTPSADAQWRQSEDAGEVRADQ